MAAANYLFASEGEDMQLNCSSNKVISWQLETKDVLVLCEGEKPMINENSSIYNRIDISSDCSILTIDNFTKEDAATYVCFITQKDKNNKDVYVQHKIHVKLRREYIFVVSLNSRITISSVFVSLTYYKSNITKIIPEILTTESKKILIRFTIF